MASTLLLSKVLGIFMIVVGAAAVLQRRAFSELVATFAADRTLRTLFSAIELLAGLFLVAMHDAWDSAPAVIVSLLGWLAVLESSAYLLLPDRIVQAFLRPFARPTVIAAFGGFALLLGLYLAVTGFGTA